MAEKICSICEKKSSMGYILVKLRGKYNPTAKKRRRPNLQWVRLTYGKNAGKRVLACTKCIKRLAKV
jgi:ribosomal protein L28